MSKERRLLLGKKQPIDKVQIHTIIGPGTKIEGKISTKDSIRIDGEVEGELKTEGHIVIGKSGKVTGDIHSASVTLEGTVEGNITVTDGVHLVSSSNLTGDIRSTSIEIEQGAIFNGKSSMSQHTTPESSKTKNKDK